MELSEYKIKFIELSNKLGLEMSIEKLKGIDCFLDFFELIKQDKSIVIIKLDGEREEGIYTFIASGKKLKEEESLRMDTSDLESGLSYICVQYAKYAWDIHL